MGSSFFKVDLVVLLVNRDQISLFMSDNVTLNIVRRPILSLAIDSMRSGVESSMNIQILAGCRSRRKIPLTRVTSDHIESGGKKTEGLTVASFGLHRVTIHPACSCSILTSGIKSVRLLYIPFECREVY